MQDKRSDGKYGRQDIADVFAEIYEDLCTSTTKKHELEHEHEDKYEKHQDTMKPSTMQELNDANLPTEKRKSGRHERSQRRDDQILYRNSQKHLIRLFIKAIKPHKPTPPNCRDTTIKVIYKSGGPGLTIELPTHLFDHHFVQTLQPTSQRTVDDNLAADQAGFRAGYSTTDHRYTFQQLRQRATEWHQRLWVAAIDFKKPSTQSVAHSSVWAALREEGAEEYHTKNYSQKLHKQLRAAVHTDVKNNKQFHFERGTKQGDPLSTLLYSLLQYIMKPTAEKCKRCHHGVRLAEHDHK